MTQTNPIPARHQPAWARLEGYAAKTKDLRLAEMFRDDPGRSARLSVDACGVHLDYSKNLLTDEILDALLDLARQCGLRQRIDAMFAGEKINTSERRAVLHVALRAPRDESIEVDGTDVVPEVHEVLDQMARFARAVRDGTWKGHTGRPIRNVVNIGIGGSDLGPAMAYTALRAYTDRDKVVRFVSNIDGADLIEATRDLDPAETLFIVCSKSWHTQETLGSPPAQIPHRVLEGNRPTTLILAERLTPANLGKLIALYEHRVFTEGVIWGIDSFDQWGVELGKILAKTIEDELLSDAAPSLDHDSSTAALIRRHRAARGRAS